MSTGTADTDICPHCQTDLRYVVEGVQYSRATSVEIRGVYDGGLFYMHDRFRGGCGFAWHRWPEGHHLRERAVQYLDQWNERNREVTENEDA